MAGANKLSMSKFKQSPINVSHKLRREVRTQFGALCWRVRNDKLQILLITSRGTGRWIIPKGWPMEGATPSEAAETEAFEEAGATGKMGTECLGIFSYSKGLGDVENLPCVVAVYPMKVEKLAREFPESNDRSRKWFSVKKAMQAVDEPELSEIIRRFAP